MKQSDVQIVQLSIQFLLLGIRNIFQFLWLSVGYAPGNELSFKTVHFTARIS